MNLNMNLTDSVNKNKNKILNIAVILLALFISSNIYSKQNQGADALRARMDTELKKNDVLTDISLIERKINAFGKLLTKKDISSAMNTIGNIAKEAGIKIASIKPELEQRYPDYTKLPFSLIINVKNYHSLGKFVSKLENNQDVYIIESIDIKSEPQQKVLIVNLKLSSISVADKR